MSDKAILYCRATSLEQEENESALAHQENLLKYYALEKGYTVEKVFSISEPTSERAQRIIFSQMLSFSASNSIKTIICQRSERLTGNLKYAVIINEWLDEDSEREVHFTEEDSVITSESEEKTIWNIKISIAHNYIGSLSEEINKENLEKLKKGLFPGPPPYGYRLSNGKPQSIYEPEPEKARILRRMFELYAEGGLTLKKLADRLYDEGFCTGSGNRIARSLLESCLSDPFYYGQIIWDGTAYPGRHEPLIDENLYNRVQELLKARSAPKYSKHSFLFKGLLMCDECGGTITWEKQKGHIYGHCNRYRKCSQTAWVKEKEVEEQLEEIFESFRVIDKGLSARLKKALGESLKEEISFHESSLSELARRDRTLKQRLNRLFEGKLDSSVSEDFFRKNFWQVTREREKVAESIAEHTASDRRYFELCSLIHDLSEKGGKFYSGSDEAAKRDLIASVFGSLTLNDGAVKFELTDPLKVLYNLRKPEKAVKAIKPEAPEKPVSNLPMAIEEDTEKPESAL